MVVLALETATRAGSVALLANGTLVARAGDQGRPHGDRLPADVTRLLAEHGRTTDDVDLFAVVVGPGSFTGLRVGIATVQGLAFGTQGRVVGVPTLDALAEGYLNSLETPPRLLVACLDGQRGEVFAGAWSCGGHRQIEAAVTILEPSAATPDDLGVRLAGLAISEGVVVVGDGGLRYADTLTRYLPGARVVAAPEVLAAAAVRLALRRAGQASAPHALRPIYLRRPDVGSAPARYIVRQVESREDLAAVEALQRQTFANPWGADAIRWELENTDVARLYVLEDPHGAVVAYCACWMVLDELHINSLAVDAALRRRGLATRLLTHILDEAVAGGATSATLEVRASNEAARRLYGNLGFKVEGVRRDYYQDPREDAVILWNRGLPSRSASARVPS